MAVTSGLCAARSAGSFLSGKPAQPQMSVKLHPSQVNRWESILASGCWSRNQSMTAQAGKSSAPPLLSTMQCPSTNTACQRQHPDSSSPHTRLLHKIKEKNLCKPEDSPFRTQMWGAGPKPPCLHQPPLIRLSPAVSSTPAVSPPASRQEFAEHKLSFSLWLLRSGSETGGAARDPIILPQPRPEQQQERGSSRGRGSGISC